MIITKFGKVVITERNNEPYIEINEFEADCEGSGTSAEVSLYAIRYAIRALQNSLPAKEPA